MSEKTFPAYDPARWVDASGATAAGLKKYLEGIPDDARLACCGSEGVYLHYCPATRVFSMDCEDLADLPEYEDRKPIPLARKEE